MRVLHVTDASSGGVLTAVTTLARAQSESAAFDRITIGYVPRSGSPTNEQIREMSGGAVHVERWSETVSARRLVSLTTGLIHAMRSDKADVIHLHSSRAGFIGRIVSARYRRYVRIIYSPHAFAFAQAGLPPWARWTYTGLERLATTFSRNLVLVSETERAVAEAHLPGIRTEVVFNAVDAKSLLDESLPHHVLLGRSGTTSTHIFRVAHIGRIAPQKAPSEFSETIDRLNALQAARGGSPVEAVWFGDGDRTLLGDTEPRIEVTGWLPPDELHKRLAEMDLIVFTSRGEGMPMALLEAQAMGIPIVASKVTGILDVVQDGQSGCLGVGPVELSELASHILRDCQLRRSMCQTAIARSFAHFDYLSLAERSLNSYRLLVGEA